MAGLSVSSLVGGALSAWSVFGGGKTDDASTPEPSGTEPPPAKSEFDIIMLQKKAYYGRR
jgi:hypothetical protein